MINAINSNHDISPWSANKSLLSETKIPLMQTDFLPFIPQSVTEYSTVYTAMKNIVSRNVHLKQKTLPVFCDEGVFRIVLDIFINNLDEFKDLLPMLRGFHMAKAVLHAVRKYVKGSGLDDILKYTKFYGPKTLQPVIAGTRYVWSLRGFQILSISIQILKWQAFWMEKDQYSFQEELKCLENLTETLNTKDAENSIKSFKNIAANIMPLIVAFREFSRKREEKSEECKYWNGIVEMTSRLQNLVFRDKKKLGELNDSDLNLHINSIEDITFLESLQKVSHLLINNPLQKKCSCYLIAN